MARLIAASLVLFVPLALAQTPAAPSDEPVPSEHVTSSDKPEAPPKLGGFDVAVSLFSSSGVFFGVEGYTNTLSLWIEPSFNLGKRFFKDRWLEPLTVNLRLPIEAELAGSDPRFRGRGFGSSALFTSPEAATIAEAQANAPPIEGTQHQALLIGDTWLSIGHAKLVTIPKAEIGIGASARFVFPTSVGSRNASLVSTASVGISVDREVGPVNLGYSVRPTKYFFSRSSPAISALSDTVLVNGREEPVWRPDSTGYANPDWGVVHGLSVELALPRGFSVSTSYLLSHVAPYRSATCAVEGTPTADLCRDGPQVGDVRSNAMRNDHWFSLDLAWKGSLFTAGLGLSTYRPINNPDGSISQPFFVANRNNYTTFYLSIAASAEQLASAFITPEKNP